MKPIVPFEPVRQDTIPLGDSWIYQVKWDGVRILTYADEKGIVLFNRHLNERTHHYPELHDASSYSKANSFILDGELIALAADGKPSFHEVMRRDGLRRLEKVPQVLKLVPIYYMVFDILYLNGNWVHDRPLRERLDLLNGMLTPTSTVQPVACHPRGDVLFEVMKKQGMEGMVCKRLDKPYVIGGKSANWVKVKNYGDIIAAIGGFTLNGGIINAVLLGLYDQAGRFQYIGHTGTGRLNQSEWKALTIRLFPDIVKECPFASRPERYKHAIWVKPSLSVKIMYTEWRLHEGRSLRQPSIQAVVDRPASECRFPLNYLVDPL